MQNDLLELKNDFQTFRKELQEIKQLTALAAKTALTMKETAQLMGVSTSHLYKLVHGKRIPYYKAGGKMTYFNRDEVTKWLLKNRVKTSSEIESEAATYLVTGKKGGKNGTN